MSAVITRKPDACDGDLTCTCGITHVGEKGWVYCRNHAQGRRGWERTRQLRIFELELIRKGIPLPSYKILPKAEVLRLVEERRRREAAAASR